MYSYTVKITQNNDILVINEDGTEISAKELLKSIPTSRVFAFYGEMGVGKTTFIQWLCKGLGVNNSFAEISVPSSFINKMSLF